MSTNEIQKAKYSHMMPHLVQASLKVANIINLFDDELVKIGVLQR